MVEWSISTSKCSSLHLIGFHITDIGVEIHCCPLTILIDCWVKQYICLYLFTNLVPKTHQVTDKRERYLRRVKIENRKLRKRADGAVKNRCLWLPNDASFKADLNKLGFSNAGCYSWFYSECQDNVKVLHNNFICSAKCSTAFGRIFVHFWPVWSVCRLTGTLNIYIKKF